MIAAPAQPDSCAWGSDRRPEASEPFGTGALLHIGYPKTASTWLQRHVFADASRGFVTPWADAAPTTPGRTWALRGWLNETDDQPFDVQALRDRLAPQLASARGTSVTPVLSEETLVGFIGHLGPDVALLRRAAAVLPGARVLLVIREQRAMVRSCYAQAIHDGTTSTLDAFLADETGIGRDARRLSPDYLRYDTLIDELHNAFGADRVRVLPYEWLRDTPERFLAALGSFVGRDLTDIPSSRTPLNPKLGPLGTVYMRRLNQRWPRSSRYTLRAAGWRFPLCRLTDRLTPPRRCARLEADMKRTIDRFVAGRFGPSNARVADTLGLDLPALGYDTSA